jgi:hypothetical protein
MTDDSALREHIRAILKEELINRNVVEIETAQAILERLTGWGKLFAYFAAIPAALFILTLVMLGISNYSDFSKLAKDATAQVQAHIDNLQKQSSKADVLAGKTDRLQAAYDILNKHFTNTQALAARVEALAEKVSQLERLALCKSPHQDLAQKLVPGFSKFQQYIAAMGYRAAQDSTVTLCVQDDPTGNAAYCDPEKRTMYVDPKYVKPGILNREYVHHVLFSLLKRRSYPVEIDGFESGLANYFPASFADNPKAVYFYDLEEKHSIPEFGDDRYNLTKIWGSVAWSLRSRIGQARADVLLFRTWNEPRWHESAPSNETLARLIAELAEATDKAAVRQVLADHGFLRSGGAKDHL